MFYKKMPTKFQKIGEKLLDTPFSRNLIQPTINRYEIDLDEYEKERFRSYKEFTERKILKEYRPIDEKKEHFISPCDGKLTVFKIKEETKFQVKNHIYSMNSLVKNDQVKNRFMDGMVLLFRFSGDEYQYFCYVDDGIQSARKRIETEDRRTCSIIQSENFGQILMVEFPKHFVSSVQVSKKKGRIYKGSEKGHFLYGAAAIVVVLQKDQVKIDEKILENSKNGIETTVYIGQKIGEKNELSTRNGKNIRKTRYE